MKDRHGRDVELRSWAAHTVAFIRRWRGLLLAPFIPALVASNCGGGGGCGGFNNACDFSIAPSPATATVAASLSVPVQLTLTRSPGFADPVAISISNAGAGVTADALTIPGSSSTGTLTLRATAGATLGPQNITITGTSGSLVKSLTYGLTVVATPTIAVTPKTLTVNAFAGAPATTFTAAIANSPGPINWTLSGPGSISNPSGPTTNYTPPSSAASVTTATLTASAPGVSDAATITINPGVVTVSGKVIDLLRQPVSGVSVRIGSTTATSAGDGSFSIPNVSLPYDASVVTTIGTTKYGTVFKGLTRSDPYLQELGVLATNRSASVSGLLSAASGSPAIFPVPGNHKTAVFFGSPDVVLSPTTNLSSGGGPAYGPFSVNWFGSLTTSGKMHALQWQFDSITGLPVNYKGYGSTDVPLANGSTLSGQNIELSSIVQDTMSASLTVPQILGVTLGKFLILRLPQGAGTRLLSDTSSGTSFSYITPRIPSATVTLIAALTTGGSLFSDKSTLGWKTGLPTNATGVNLTLDDIPTLVSPASGATSVNTGTTFQASGPSGTLNLFFFSSTGGPVSQFYYVLTTATTTTIPDLSAQNMTFPTSGAIGFNWNFVRFKPYPTTDAGAGPNGYITEYYKAFLGLISTSANAGPDFDGGVALAEQRSFTTP